MADRSTRLTIRVLLDAGNAVNELNQLGDEAGGIGGKLGKLAAAGAAFAGVTAFIKGAVDAASNLQQSMGGVEAVFKGSAGQIKQWGSQAADTLGLSQSAYQDLAVLIGSQLKNAGTAMDDLAPKTNDLIETGADLAAMFGGTTADAVGALSSALKGERDPIEKYGVSLTEAAIQGEIMALGLDTTTEAAKAAAKATATLSLITKQTGDAQGAAAREIDSYASVQQRVSAVWENTMAQVGSALLPVLSQLGAAFADIMPVIGALLTPLASLLAMVLDLPAPILLVGTALLAWSIMGGLAGIIAGVSAAVSFLSASVKKLWVSLGPIGIAIIAITTAFSFLNDDSDETASVLEDVQASADALKGTLDATTGAVTEATRAMVANDAQSAGLLTTYEQLGLSTQLFVDASTGAVGAADDLAASVASLSSNLVTGNESFKSIATDVAAAGVSVTDFVAAANSGDFSGLTSKVQAYAEEQARATGNTQTATDIMNAWQGTIDATSRPLQQLAGAQDLAAQTATGLGVAAAGTAQVNEALGVSSEAAAEAAAKQAEEQNKAAEAAAKAAAENTAVKGSLDLVKSAADSAAAGIEFYVLQMNLANGISVSADQAAQLLNASMRDTAAAFKESAEGGGINTEALLSWNVAALTSTEAGDGLYEALTKSQTAYATSTVTAYQNAAAQGDTAAGMAAAASAADTAYAAFIQTASAAGLTGDQAAALAGKLGIVQGTQIDPKTFDLIAQDQQADAALAELQNAQIDPKTVQVNAATSDAAAAIDQTAAAAPPATIDTSADTKQAQSQIQSTAGASYKSTVAVGADVAQANSQINAFTSAARNITVQVQANTGPAQSAVTSLVLEPRTKQITVTANTGPAESSIAAVVNRSYTATINVSANVAAANAAIASVPRTLSIAPPPAAPQGFSAMAAPMGFSTFAAAPEAAPVIPWHAPLQLAGELPGAGGGSVTYNVEITGTVTDPDGAARAIERLLQRRQRRAGSVYVG
jgi:hypothetical protein